LLTKILVLGNRLYDYVTGGEPVGGERKRRLFGGGDRKCGVCFYRTNLLFGETGRPILLKGAGGVCEKRVGGGGDWEFPDFSAWERRGEKKGGGPSIGRKENRKEGGPHSIIGIVCLGGGALRGEVRDEGREKGGEKRVKKKKKTKAKGGSNS